jgi:hypothetical protein
MIFTMPIRLRLNPLALLLTLVLCLPLTARADDTSRRAKAAQMVELLHTERMVQQASVTILKQVSDAAEKAAGPNPTPQNKAQLADFENKTSQMIDAQEGWKALEPAIADFYAKTFTEQELDVIIAFFKTPASTAFLDKMPTINAQIDQLAKSKLAILQPQITQSFEDFSKSQAPPTAAPATPAVSPAATRTPAASPAPAVSKPK